MMNPLVTVDWLHQNSDNPNLIILDATMISDSKCSVKLIDLRPVGINLYGTTKNLIAGKNSFVGNTYKGISFMIGFND